MGIILLGEAIEDERDPAELKGTGYFRVLGFLMDSGYRRQGIGSAALNMAINAIRAEYGHMPLLLECHGDNLAALRFYEKHGFENTHILNEQDDNWFMILG